jgi:signal transduction histidine kinase
MELLEKERARIAFDLHDELGPILAVTQMHLNTIDISKNDEPHFLKVNENLQHLTERLSEIAKNLTPKILIRKGLEVGIKDFIEQIEGSGKISVNLEYAVKTKLDILQSLHMYRMIQELIHNTIKHSKATAIDVKIKERKDRIFLLYSDNGIGISNTEKKLKIGLGEGSIKNRIEMLGGKMEKVTERPAGVEYFFEIPVKPIYERSNQDLDR